MSSSLIVPFLLLWATLMRTLLVQANILPPTCGRCGRHLERRRLGEPVCRCGH